MTNICPHVYNFGPRLVSYFSVNRFYLVNCKSEKQLISVTASEKTPKLGNSLGKRKDVIVSMWSLRVRGQDL